jgi:NADH:ubiquinone oxidoreductase subunit 2 (subunit N)
MLFCALFSIFLGTFMALNQKRLKKLIIYSSISQTGFIVAALAMANIKAYFVLLFFIIIYLITSILI